MPDHKERPAAALAHGTAKSSDIERARRDVDKAEVRVAVDDETSAIRRTRRVRDREAARTPDA